MKNHFERPCFIVNASSDRNRAVRHVSWIRQEAKKEWALAEIVIVEKGRDLTRLAAEKSEVFDLVVACGGDGTVSRIAAGLAGKRAALGLLPMGSGNDFALAAGLHRSLPECMDILKRGEVTPFDMIRYSGDAEGWCANTIGLGLDGLANYYAGKNTLLKGSALYLFGLLKAISRFRGSALTITTGDQVTTGHFMMATLCNGPREGGRFVVAPHADPSDGFLELLTIRKIPISLLLGYLPFFLKGPARWMRGVDQHSCQSLQIHSSQPLAVHCDGEHLSSDIRHLRMEVREGVLNVVK